MIEKIWHLHIITIQNNQILLSNVMIASILILLGIKILPLFKKWLEKFSDKFNALKGAEQKFLLNIITISVSILYIIITLNILNFPLSVFAFLGGAIALGIGFGAQNIIHNVVSGIVVIIEKPFKSNDIIKINNIVGSVENINLRYTAIKGINNQLFLIPNNVITQSSLINLTRNGSIIQMLIKLKIPRATNVDFDNVINTHINNNDIHYPNVSFSTNLADIDELFYYQGINCNISTKKVKLDLYKIKNEITQIVKQILNNYIEDYCIDSVEII